MSLSEFISNIHKAVITMNDVNKLSQKQQSHYLQEERCEKRDYKQHTKHIINGTEQNKLVNLLKTII